MDYLLSQGLIGAARDHLWHHHTTSLLERLSRMWAKRPEPMPSIRSLYPAAWRLWFERAAKPRGTAERLAAIFERKS